MRNSTRLAVAAAACGLAATVALAWLSGSVSGTRREASAQPVHRAEPFGRDTLRPRGLRSEAGTATSGPVGVRPAHRSGPTPSDAPGHAQSSTVRSLEHQAREAAVGTVAAKQGVGAAASTGNLVLLGLETNASTSAGTSSETTELRLLGIDRGAPRSLVLWEIDSRTGRAAELAWVESEADGAIRADSLLLPASAFSLVVAPVGSAPFGEHASAPLEVAALPPEPVQAWVQRSTGASVESSQELFVVAIGGAFTLVLGDAEGRELAQLPVPAATFTQRAVRMLRFEVGTDARKVLRALPDGRRSSWREIGVRAESQPSFTAGG